MAALVACLPVEVEPLWTVKILPMLCDPPEVDPPVLEPPPDVLPAPDVLPGVDPPLEGVSPGEATGL